jgi:CBS-domain-containing membrane protein
VAIESADPLSPLDSLASVAKRMLRDESGFVCVCDQACFRGVVYIESVLDSLAADRHPPDVRKLVSEQIPTCMPTSALVDAVQQMVACYLRKIPVIARDGALIGLLSLAEASAAAERDPAVGEVIERLATFPSFFARRWR